MASGVIAFPFELAIYTISLALLVKWKMENFATATAHLLTMRLGARTLVLPPSFGNVKLIYNFGPSHSRVLTLPAASSSRSFGIF